MSNAVKILFKQDLTFLQRSLKHAPRTQSSDVPLEEKAAEQLIVENSEDHQNLQQEDQHTIPENVNDSEYCIHSNYGTQCDDLVLKGCHN